MTETMLDDHRTIKSIYFNGASASGCEVGKNGCSKIEAYGEPGEYCNKPWIAVYVGDELTTRIPAEMVQIFYV